MHVHRCDQFVARAGLDDVNEFESELEAEDKWKRRFRILSESSGSSEDSPSSSMENHAPESDAGSVASGSDAPGGAADAAGAEDASAEASGQAEHKGPELDDDAETGRTGPGACT